MTKVSISVCKFIAYIPHITGVFFHLDSVVISLTNLNVNVLLTQFYGFCKVTFAGKAYPVIFRFDQFRNALMTSTRRL